MTANSISNFSSIHLIPSSGQGIAVQQQIAIQQTLLLPIP